MNNIKNCTIIGCGFVGSSIAFALVRSGIFSDLLLIDVDKNKSEGEAMDLSHCLPFTRPMTIHSGTYEDIKDSGIIIIAAGAGQKPGETRRDLVNKNIIIFKSIIGEIKKYNQEAMIIVVSNPVDILTYATLKMSGFAPQRVIGSGTILDTARIKYQLGKRLNIDPRVVHAIIIGEHGDSELPVWSSANISGIDLDEYCKAVGKPISQEEENQIYEDVKNSAYEIIEKKGATYYGIAMAVKRLCESIVRDEHAIFTVSTLVTGHFDLNNLCLGVPTVIGSSGAEMVIDIPLSELENKRLKKSAEELSNLIKQCKL